MLENLITSKTRIKLLVKFFVNAQTKSYLRSLETEFGESSNAIRVELNRFEEAGLLVSETQGNRKYFSANTGHAFFHDIHHLLMKYVGIDTLVDKVINEVGNLVEAYIIGDMARGIQGKVIDILLVGQPLDQAYISRLIKKAEELVSFRIRYMAVSPDELSDYLPDSEPRLLVWSKNP
ncbi:ArsR family transcriptional regulator [Roseimarinus sediminis]|uniref:ArsR family transcriptional regulator n=1 Tax=Roseimarinus sediminis TaxID=1610899 RepID=UPI003D243365